MIMDDEDGLDVVSGDTKPVVCSCIDTAAVSRTGTKAPVSDCTNICKSGNDDVRG